MTTVVSNLVETGTRKYVKMMLNRSHEFRQRHYNFFFNIALLTLFIILVSGTLTYMHYTKETKNSKKLKQLSQRNYIIDKLHAYKRSTIAIDGAYNTPLSSNNQLVSNVNYSSFTNQSFNDQNIFNENKENSDEYHHTQNIRNNDPEIKQRHQMKYNPNGTTSTTTPSVLNEEEIRRALQQGTAYSKPTKHSTQKMPTSSSAWLYSMINLQNQATFNIPKYNGIVKTIETSLL